jgi:enoyl-CoA hydratase/carnithine racemase
MTTFDDYARKFETIRMQRTDGILEVQFHTNGGPLQWSLVAHREFEQAFLDIGRDRDNEVVVMTGSGDVFCGPAVPPGGHHLRKAMTPTSYDPIYWEGKHLLVNLLDIEVPVIGAINGPILRHAEVPLVSDIVLAADDMFIQDTAHFQGGMVPGDGTHLIFPLIMGATRARYFMFTGQKISAAEALNLGLVNEVLPRADLMPRARELAKLLLLQPRLVRRYTRVCVTHEMKRQMHDMLGYGLALEGIARMKEPA